MFSLRQRRGRTSRDPSPVGFGTYADRAGKKGLGTAAALLILISSRLISAAFNIVHDCDEVYNYWEPLHYLMYGYGMQTWEYSSEFALRSYFYLLLHSPVALLAALLAGAGAGKMYVFYATKACLGIISALTETALYRATRDYAGPPTGHYLLVLLATSSGMFAAASSLLPSSFAMYMLTLAAAGVLRSRPWQIVVAAVICVVWGWPVAGIALVPYAFSVLFSGKFLRCVLVALATLAGTLTPLIAMDRLFYCKWTVSLWNFIRYNVIGGGDSALYGVESAYYYLRNGAINLNVVLPLALVAPLVLVLWPRRRPGAGVQWRMLVAISPAWVWLAAITALPHKEERFLYVVYPLMCLSSAAVLATIPSIISRTCTGLLPRQLINRLGFWVPAGIVAVFVALSVLRAVALTSYYGAPMQIYRHLPEVTVASQRPGNETYVCVGDEWHRFPSSFFLPSPAYRLAFLKSGFHGLLPRAFDTEQGGTAAAPPELNDRNQEEPANYWEDASRCQFLVEMREASNPPRPDAEEWREIAAQPFVLGSQSPSMLARVLYVPWFSHRRNHYVAYRLLERAAGHVPQVLEHLSTAATTRGRPF